MKAAHFLLEQSLPEKFRGRLKGYTSRDIGKFMEQVAEESPQDYARVNQAVGDVGRLATWRQGDTISMRDLKTPFDKKKLWADMDRELEAADKSNADAKHKAEARMKVHLKYNDLLQSETTRGATAGGSPFAQSVLSGARGKMPQLKAMIGGTGLYQDHFGNVVPVFGRNSFAEGVRPIDYLASTYGARTSVTVSKQNTAKGGYLGKLATSITSNLSVTGKDCGTANGIDLAPDDDSLVGRVLVAPVGDHPAGTLINSKIARDIRSKNPDTVLVRSALSCQAEHGICAKCAGATTGGKLPSIGDQVGITAGQALFEPVIQSSLCLAEGTLVRMADFSSKPIESIRPGDMVMGADKSGHTFPVKVNHLFDQGLQLVQRREFTPGSTKIRLNLESTAEHKMLVNTKSWGRTVTKTNAVTRILKAGKKHKNFGAVLPVSCAVGGYKEPMALLLGAFLGDGNRWAEDAHHVGVSCADLTQIEDLNATLAPLNLIFKKCKRSHDWRLVQIKDVVARDVTTGRTLSGMRNGARCKLKEWGLQGKYAHDKTVPDCVWGWDDASVVELLAGYVATDGSVYTTKEGYPRISFASVSKPLLEGIQRLLQERLCVYTSDVSLHAKAGTNKYVHDCWTFSVANLTQVKKLARAVRAHVPGVKRARLDEILLKPDHEHQRDEFVRAIRKTTVELGQKPCWDIEVDHEDHLFVLANGLIVSNSMKHIGGAATGGKKVFSGLKVIQDFLQMPDEYPDRATVSESDGRVESVEDAPQGGKFVTVSGHKHYVPQGLELNVKAGDTVEAGDALSDGLVSPADVIRHKGLGEGRRYYAERYKKILDDSGYKAHSRNAEAMARAAIDHVDVGDEGVADYLPDDTVSYNRVSALYTPPEDAKAEPLGHGLVGKYLQAPVLHYSIGTRITPSVLKRLDRAKVGRVTVSANSDIPFTPVGNRLATATAAGDDWLAKQQSSYLGANIADDALRGRDTNIESNTHWAPRLAYGAGFGKNVETTGKF